MCFEPEDLTPLFDGEVVDWVLEGHREYDSVVPAPVLRGPEGDITYVCGMKLDGYPAHKGRYCTRRKQHIGPHVSGTLRLKHKGILIWSNGSGTFYTYQHYSDYAKGKTKP